MSIKGTVVLTGDAGTGKSELAKMVLKSTETYNSLLIESLTPKKKGLLSEVISKPCIELSQVLQGLLSFNTMKSTHNTNTNTADGTTNDGATGDGGGVLADRVDSFNFDANSDSYANESELPKTVSGWKRRLKACISLDKLNELKDDLDCFDEYFDEWIDEKDDDGVSEVRFLGSASLPTHSIDETKEHEKYHNLNDSNNNNTSSSTESIKLTAPSNTPLASPQGIHHKTVVDPDSISSVMKKINKFEHMSSTSINMGSGSSGAIRRGSGVKASFREDGREEIVEEPSADARRRVLSALLDHVLHSSSARPLMIFVHGTYLQRLTDINEYTLLKKEIFKYIYMCVDTYNIEI